MRPPAIAAGIAVCIAAPVMYFTNQIKPPSDSIPDFGQWNPTAQEIHAKLDKATFKGTPEERSGEFLKQFKSRFRQRQIAVNVKFPPEGGIKVYCAANIPHQDMARIGIAALKEAEALFGPKMPAEIYETYISLPSRKIANIERAASGDRLQIEFREDFPSPYNTPTPPKPAADKSANSKSAKAGSQGKQHIAPPGRGPRMQMMPQGPGMTKPE
jgi:hypothetical protein